MAVQIVSWLLTRRCNLKCSYCAITRTYKGIPKEYPSMKHYYENEMDTKYVVDVLRKLKKHNPDCFHIFYGGEPLMRRDLSEIINYCNIEDIHYTIISNNTVAVEPYLESLLAHTDYISGYTASVDPIIMSDEKDSDRLKKSLIGFAKLKQFKGVIKDVVAEITVDDKNVHNLHPLIVELSSHGISSDITFIDIAKSKYYDFSNIRDKKLLVNNKKVVEEQFDKIIKDRLDVHMAETLLPEMVKILPSNLNCGIEKDFHNMTIDADGTLRLCLRIKGVLTPKIKAIDAFVKNGQIDPFLLKMIKKDKKKYCRGCNWSCMVMSKMLSKNQSGVEELVHTTKREG